MASVSSQLIQEVAAHAQSDSLEDAREICADGTYFPNNLRKGNIVIPEWKTYSIAIIYVMFLCRNYNKR